MSINENDQRLRSGAIPRGNLPAERDSSYSEAFVSAVVKEQERRTPVEVLRDERHTSAADVLNALIPRALENVYVKPFHSDHNGQKFNKTEIRMFPDGLVECNNMNPGGHNSDSEVTRVRGIIGGNLDVSFDIPKPPRPEQR